ncbi:MarR family winged helix-turn-helix transcriptional regulator [Rothia nasimurium]|uniref:MarR family winged helix-turn-helix transcriptional regulator n=1 Tax=Rothia nasimurium TaxID=85336 RepID=UPI001F2F1A16|nr:MarR family winged helix-turn-helix transcriptional regulator [Rothia nasimurium]
MENFLQEQAGTLRYAVFRMHRRLRNETASHSPLSFAEETVLDQLRVTPRQTGAELARFQRMTPQSMNKIVASLLHRGYLASGKNLHDKRRKELYLTEHGRATITALIDRRDAWLVERAAEIFNEDEAARLSEALPLLRRLADRESRYETPADPNPTSSGQGSGAAAS